MRAVDTNILVYAHRGEVPKHAQAERHLREMAEGIEPWGLPVFVIGEFLRVVTNPRFLNPPSTLEEATGYIDRLLGSPSVHVLYPATNFWPAIRTIILQARVRGNVIFDAMIAAVCSEHGVVEVLSEDRDFSKFPGIKVIHLD